MRRGRRTRRGRSAPFDRSVGRRVAVAIPSRPSRSSAPPVPTGSIRPSIPRRTPITTTETRSKAPSPEPSTAERGELGQFGRHGLSRVFEDLEQRLGETTVLLGEEGDGDARLARASGAADAIGTERAVSERRERGGGRRGAYR